MGLKPNRGRASAQRERNEARELLASEKSTRNTIIKLGRCIECGKHNHRWPKSRCSACLQKKTVKARRKQIESRLE